MTRRYGRIELGAKGPSAKLRALLQRLPARALAEVRGGLSTDVERVRAQVLAGEIEHPRDREFFARYAGALAVLQGVVGLLADAPGLRSIAAAIDEAHEHYMPGGPPLSPVHDSLFVNWSMFDLEVGRPPETVAQLVLDCASLLGLDAEIRETLRTQAGTHLGLYRVLAKAPGRAGDSSVYRARELVTRLEVSLQFAQEFHILVGDLLLVRPTSLSEDEAKVRNATHLAWPTPYVLDGTDPEWIDYFERAAGELRVRLDPDVYLRIMRGAGDPRRWLEYVVDGYVGQREHNVVLVEGIPDRPETLEHHPLHRPEHRFAIPKGTPARERALILARQLSVRFAELRAGRARHHDDAVARQIEALTAAGGTADAWIAPLLAALSHEVGTGGEPPLGKALATDPTLEPDLREYLGAALDGFTSIFEVVSVRSGVGMTLRDLVDHAEYDVEERSATTDLPTRLVLWARLVRYREVWTVDALHPQPLLPAFRDDAIAQVCGLLAAHRRRRTPADPAALFAAMVAWQRMLSTMMEAATIRPTVTTTSGEPVVLSRAGYRFEARNRDRVLVALTRLRRCHRDVDGDAPSENGDRARFVITSDRGDVEAILEVGPLDLTIQTNSVDRLTRVRQRITAKLPGVLSAPHTEFVDLETAAASAAPRVTQQPTAEMKAVVAQALRRRYAAFLDEPIPALRGHSPRVAAARPELRAALDTLLREHEFHVTREFGPALIDFAAMRRELGLSP